MDLPAVCVATTESLLATLSISHQAGHLCAGLIIYLGVPYLLSARWGHILPLLAVFLAEFGNETLQAAHYWQLADGGYDRRHRLDRLLALHRLRLRDSIAAASRSAQGPAHAP